MRSVKKVLPLLVLVIALVAASSPPPLHSQLSCFPPDGYCFALCQHGTSGGFCLDVSFNEYFCHPYPNNTGCLGYMCSQCL